MEWAEKVVEDHAFAPTHLKVLREQDYEDARAANSRLR